MRFASIIRLRLRWLFSRKKVEAELDEELRDRLHRQIGEGLATGLTPEDARYAALQPGGQARPSTAPQPLG
jgi:hypothetical protein